MPSSELASIAESVIASLEPGTLSDECIQKLQSVFPDNLLLAALDLVDHENVLEYTTPWGTSHYEVRGTGSAATYTVLPSLSFNVATLTPKYCCTCPSFMYNVLKSDSYLMCKHILATRIAQQVGLCVERPVTQDELAAILIHQYL